MIDLLPALTRSRSHFRPCFPRHSAFRPRTHGRERTHVTPKTLTPGSRTRKVGSRFLEPQFGRWISRDPVYTHPNNYRFVRNSPAYGHDALGLWTDIPGKEEYQAQYGDTLEALAEFAGGAKEDWECLWPVQVRNPGEYPYVSACDIYSVENIWAISGSQLNIAIGGGGPEQEFEENPSPPSSWKGFKKLNWDQVYQEMRDVSKEGGNPISRMWVYGHGGIGAFDIENYWPIPNPKDPSGAVAPEFQSGFGFVSFEMRKKKRGPSRCWFTPTAEVRLFGCTSDTNAKLIAKRLRRTKAITGGRAHAIGTNYDTYSWFGPMAPMSFVKYGWEGGAQVPKEVGAANWFSTPMLWGPPHYGEL